MDIKKRNRAELKSYFVQNSLPTEGNFADLIDGMLNQKDDDMVKLPGEPLSLQATGDQTSLKKVINFYADFVSTKPAWTLSLHGRTEPDKPETNKPGWNLSDGDGRSRLFIDYNSGKVGIGSLTPRTPLDVNGEIVAVNRLTLAQDTGETTKTWHVDNSGGLFRLFWQPNIKTGGTSVLEATTTGEVSVKSSLTIAGSKIISFARDEGDQSDAGKIVYKPSWKSTGLSIVGAGNSPRQIDLFDDVFINGSVSGNGGLTIKGERRISFKQDEGDNSDAGKIVYKPSWASGGLSIVGAGNSPRKIDLYDEVTVNNSLMIARNVLIGSSKSIRFTLNPNERVDCGFIEYSTSALEISGAGATGTVAEKKPKKINLYDEVTIGSSTNPIRFTSGWSGFSGVKKDEANNRAEISNDTNDYKELMIVGNTSRGTVWPTNTNHLQRRVGVWDRLDVHGELDVHGLLFQHAPMIEKNSQTDWTKNDHPLQVYFKEKLAGQPRGTMLCVMAAQWDGFPHFWIGCVTGDNKKWITYLKCPDGGGARLLE